MMGIGIFQAAFLLQEKYTMYVEEVEKELMAVKLTKSGGTDEWPRDFAGILTKPISVIFNMLPSRRLNVPGYGSQPMFSCCQR